MPAIVGAIQIVTMGSASVLHVGDVYKISSSSNAKTFAGAGSFNTGEKIYVYNHKSTTNTFDQDGVDQPNMFNV